MSPPVNGTSRPSLKRGQRSVQHRLPPRQPRRAEHSGGTHRFLTGYPSVAANLQNAEFPDIGSVVAKPLQEQERTRVDIFSYVHKTTQ